MSSHTSRTFLHSCLKTPIDPCNNCPAPIYNRPRMYLGRLPRTPASITTTTAAKYATARTRQGATETETENETAMWGACSGLRSLAKLYDSIPDYCDLNHLSEGEFYSTLNTLRTTCNALKTKPLLHCESSCSTKTDATATTTTSSSSQKEHKKAKKKSKTTAKKKSSKSAGGTKKSAMATQKPIGPEEITLESSWHLRAMDAVTPRDVMGYEKTTVSRSSAAPKSNYKQECEDEVAAFRRTLKDFEEELKRTSYTTVPTIAKATTRCKDYKSSGNLTKIGEHASEKAVKTAEVSIPPSKEPSGSVRNKLKKSFSFNDLHSIAESDESLEAKMQANANASSAKRITKAEMLAFRDHTKLSNYFATKHPEPSNDLPRIVVDTPSSDTTASSEISIVGGPRRKSKSKKRQDELKLPFPVFSYSDSKKENVKARSVSVSPKHPVARPNLAATLRAEVSKKKLKELQNTCTYHDPTPPVDWEVRKTPAWKSLSLNETHKQILAMRLATRKAEQDLQKREYDLNMELMRQRVKSAPLLLEGVTFWGPNVGKLTHTCQMDGLQHACHSSLRKQRKKSAAAGGNRRTGGGGSDIGTGCGSRLSNKFQSLRKIYASSAGTCSRQSQRSAVSEGGGGGGGGGSKQKRSAARSRTPIPATRAATAATEATNDSGDELCSVDRAYL